MHPILFQLGGFTLYTYGVIYLTAFLVGILVTAKLATRAGVPFTRTVDAMFLVAIAGELGARLTFVITDWHRFAAGSISLRQFLAAGRVVLGGVAVGLPFAVWIFRRYRLPVMAVIDALGAAMPLSMGIGRLGCLSAGCCFGKPTDWWWGITFSDPLAHKLSGTPLGVALHPTQILQALVGFVLFGFLAWLHGRKRFDGQIIATFLLLAGVARFGMEFLRGDPRGAAAGLSTSQWIGIALAACGAVWMTLGLRRAGRDAPAGARSGGASDVRPA